MELDTWNFLARLYSTYGNQLSVAEVHTDGSLRVSFFPAPEDDFVLQQLTDFNARLERLELAAKTDDKPPLADRVVALENRCARLEAAEAFRFSELTGGLEQPNE